MEDFELHLNSMELSTIVTKVDRRLSTSTYGTVGAQPEHRRMELDGRAIHAARERPEEKRP